MRVKGKDPLLLLKRGAQREGLLAYRGLPEGVLVLLLVVMDLTRRIDLLPDLPEVPTENGPEAPPEAPEEAPEGTPEAPVGFPDGAPGAPEGPFPGAKREAGCGAWSDVLRGGPSGVTGTL